MNTWLRFSAFTFALLCTGAFGYFVGQRRTSPGSTRLAPATPLPLQRDAGTSPLGSTALGRLIDGKSDFQRVRALYEHAITLDVGALPGAVNEAMQLPLQHRNMALGILFARWSELDPAAAVKYLELLPKSANPSLLRRTALAAWAEQDFPAALAWAQSLEKSETRKESLASIAGTLAKRDPAAALKLIDDHFAGREAANAYDAVFSAWAEKDFASAYAAAAGIGDSALRTRALRAALNQKVDSDPRAVLEAVRMAKLADLRWDLGNRAMSRWLERDFTAARDYAMALAPGELRDQQVSQVGREMARRDPQGAVDWLRSLSEDASRDEAISGLFTTWASTDPKAAVEGAHSLPEGPMRDSALSQLASNLVDSDLPLALSLVKELPSGTARETAYQGIAWRWARSDPKAAAEWFIENLSSNNRWPIQQVINEWGRSDPSAAIDWAIALPDSMAQKGELLGQVLGNYGRNDPVAAAASIEKLAPDHQASAIRAFVGNWAYRDPLAAAKWGMGLKNEEAQASAISGVTASWANRDAAAAARWLDTLKPGAPRDSAVQSYSYTASEIDPNGAMAWAMTIGDREKRENSLQGVFATWAQRDPAAAEQWLNTAGNLAEPVKAKLAPLLEQQPGPQFPGRVRRAFR